MDLGILITAAIALIVGGVVGYAIFRYVIKGKYNEMITAADKEAEVIHHAWHFHHHSLATTIVRHLRTTDATAHPTLVVAGVR